MVGRHVQLLACVLVAMALVQQTAASAQLLGLLKHEHPMRVGRRSPRYMIMPPSVAGGFTQTRSFFVAAPPVVASTFVPVAPVVAAQPIIIPAPTPVLAPIIRPVVAAAPNVLAAPQPVVASQPTFAQAPAAPAQMVTKSLTLTVNKPHHG